MGFSLSDSEQLLNSGYDKHQADNTRKLVAIGYTPTQVLELQKSGVDYFALEAWMDENFSKEEILVFRRAGFSTDVARQWKGMGLSLPEIQFLLEEGLTYVLARRASEFKKLNLSISDCVVLSVAKYDAEDVKRLSDSGMNVAAIVDWAKTGIEQKEAIGWVRSLTTLAEAEKWRQVGLTFSDVVRLKLEGFEMEDVLKWNSSELPSEQVTLPQQELESDNGAAKDRTKATQQASHGRESLIVMTGWSERGVCLKERGRTRRQSGGDCQKRARLAILGQHSNHGAKPQRGQSPFKKGSDPIFAIFAPVTGSYRCRPRRR